jgi:hypothetical protein
MRFLSLSNEKKLLQKKFELEASSFRPDPQVQETRQNLPFFS